MKEELYVRSKDGRGGGMYSFHNPAPDPDEPNYYFHPYQMLDQKEKENWQKLKELDKLPPSDRIDLADKFIKEQQEILNPPLIC